MNKKTIAAIIVVLIIIATLILTWYFNQPDELAEVISDQPSHITVTSDDSKFELEIPEGALPDGIDVGSITITSTPGKTFDPPIHKNKFFAIYKLEPHDLVLSSPARYTVTFELEDSETTALIIPGRINEEQKTLLVSDADISIIQERNELNIKGELSSFSHHAFFNIGYLDLVTPYQVKVKESFPVSAKVELFNAGVEETVSVAPYPYGGKTFFDPHWDLKGDMNTYGGIITPKHIPDLPPLTNIASTSFTSKANFTCAQGGETNINYVFTIKRIKNTEYKGAWGWESKASKVKYTVDYDSRKIHCEFPLVDEPKDALPEDPKDPVDPQKQMKKIQVVTYGNSHIPIEQLKMYAKEECGCCDEPHWHALSGTCATLAGQTVIDPYEKCGIGKLSEMPITEIEVEVEDE